jgi:ABC-type lipoprotein release transport system permease subunit
MRRYRSLPVLAVRRMLGNWRLLSSVVIGTFIAAAILSATSIYADAIRDLGLRHAIDTRAPRTLDVAILQGNINVVPDSYERSLERQDLAVRRALGDAAGPAVRHAHSATFFPTAPGAAVDRADTNRPRGNLFVRSNLRQHVEVVEGTFPEPHPRGRDGPIPVLIGAETAERLGIRVGQRFDLHPFWDQGAEPLVVEVSGLGVVVDPDDRYWGRRDELLEARERSWETLLFAIPQETLFGAARERLPTITAELESTYQVNLDALNARNADVVANGLRSLRPVMEATETRVTVRSDLESVLRTYDEKLFFTRIPLFVLLLQIGGIVAYYLVMVSTMLVERQAAEIATLRSRGATTGQLLAQYGVEGGILAVLATLIGPPLAAAVISALGPTPAFSALSGGGPLEVHLSGLAYVLAGGGALLAFLALMLPAWRATRSTVVEFKRSSARPRPTPFFLRYYLDVALVIVLALVFWRLSRQEELFSETLFGETQADPFLLATPAVFMVTVGIVFLRLFPLVLTAAAWLIERTRSVAVVVGMRSVVRHPTHYTRLILLLMFATGVGMFGATFSATLAQSYEDRASYLAGADVRFGDVRGDVATGDRAFVAMLDELPADGATPVFREGSGLLHENERRDVTVLGIDPATFGDVARVREDFVDVPLDQMLSTLDANSVTYEGITLPEDARQVGVWLRFTQIRGRMLAGFMARDATGQVQHYFLASGVPADEAAGGWQFYTADLDAPRGRTGSLIRGAQPLQPPLEVHGLYFSPQGQVARQQATIDIGPMYAISQPPDTSDPPEPASSAWPGADLVTSFSSERFEVVQGVVQRQLPDQFRSTSSPPPGESSAMRYEWQDAGFSPVVRGISLRTDGQPTAVYVSRDILDDLGLAVGDHAQTLLAGRHLRVEVAGAFDFFPTFEANGRRGFVIASAPRLFADANAALPDRAARYNEAWLTASNPGALVAAIEPLEPRHLLVREDVLLEQQEDPLIAAGWAGILAIAFGAVLLLSAIGFVVYSYLTAQQRGLEFAILRTLGLSRPQVFSVVLFEHLLIIVAGMGLGTIVGLRVGELMMDFLATDETGQTVLPPFVLQVSWAEVAAVWAILGTVFVITIAVVVALYLRLAVHRALRIGDA